MSSVCPKCNGPITLSGDCFDECGWVKENYTYHTPRTVKPSFNIYNIITQLIPIAIILAAVLSWTIVIPGPPLPTKNLGRVDEDTLSLGDKYQDKYDERRAE